MKLLARRQEYLHSSRFSEYFDIEVTERSPMDIAFEARDFPLPFYVYVPSPEPSGLHQQAQSATSF